MKNKLTIFLSALLFFVIWSCKKDEHKIYYEAGTPPVLSSSPTVTIPLSFATKDQEAIRLNWTNPEYKFTTGIISQNLSYQLEIDTTGSNFTNPQRKVIAISNDLALTISQNDFNDYLLNQLVLKPGVS